MKHIKKMEELNEAQKKPNKVYKPKDLQTFGGDYKDVEGILDELKKALKKFGINMYDDPSVEGSDSYQFYLSKEKLSKKQLEAISDAATGLV